MSTPPKSKTIALMLLLACSTVSRVISCKISPSSLFYHHFVRSWCRAQGEDRHFGAAIKPHFDFSHAQPTISVNPEWPPIACGRSDTVQPEWVTPGLVRQRQWTKARDPDLPAVAMPGKLQCDAGIV